jgi:hypothetical protein
MLGVTLCALKVFRKLQVISYGTPMFYSDHIVSSGDIDNYLAWLAGLLATAFGNGIAVFHGTSQIDAFDRHHAKDKGERQWDAAAEVSNLSHPHHPGLFQSNHIAPPTRTKNLRRIIPEKCLDGIALM